MHSPKTPSPPDDNTQHDRPPTRDGLLPSTIAPIAEAFAEQLVDAMQRRISDRGGLLPPPTDQPLLDIKGVARRLSVSVRTVETLIAEGQIVPVAVRGQRRFTPESVDAYIRSSVRGAGRRRGR